MVLLIQKLLDIKIVSLLIYLLSKILILKFVSNTTNLCSIVLCMFAKDIFELLLLNFESLF